MNEEELLQGDTFQLTEEEQLQLQQRQAEAESNLQQLDNAATQQPMPAATAQVPEEQELTEQPTEPEKFGFLDKATSELTTAPGAAIADFAVDAFNLVTQQEVPKIPEFENEVAQSIREISSIVIPTVLLSGYGTMGLASKAKNIKFFADPLVKKIGATGFSMGAGAAVDYTVEINQKDDNLAGSLKKSWPRWMGWIPDNIATLDTDSQDVKRAKNVTEGVALGAGVDVLLGINKLAKGLRGIARETQWTPETEKAKNWFNKNITKEGTPEEVIEESAGRRAVELDEVGGYNFEKSVNPDEPVFGYHDLYGYQEQGIRSVDDLGIVGASVDYVRIDKNIDTVYGRVGSVMSEGALKFGLEGVENGEMIIKGLAEGLKDADKYGYKTASGRYITHDEIMQAGDKLAGIFYEMDVPQLKRALAQFQSKDGDTGVKVLNSEAYAGTIGAIKEYMKDFMDMDYMKAQAYVGTSVSGQISDMAQGMRLTEGTPTIARAQEQILDRVEFLMAQKGMTSYSRGRALNMLNLWNRMTKSGSDAMKMAESKRLHNLVKNEKNTTLATMERIKQESKEVVDNLRVIKEERPEMLAPLMMAYEMTDGNVNTIHKLNQYLKNSTGVFSKALIDLNPNIPSVVMRGFWANVYNGTLGAFATPLKAGASGAYLLAEKPLRTMGGALLRGDLKTVRRGWYQYNSMMETMQSSFQYMNQIYKRSALDPYVIEARDNIGLKNEAQVDLINAFADASAERGEYGPQVMAQFVNDQVALGKHPWLRFGTRAMQAEDGFVQAAVAVAEAKGRAYDEITKGGAKEFNREESEALYKKVYAGMFNEDGIITDEAVKHAAGEIAMNLDNDANRALSNLITHMPGLKPFLLFTKTPVNDLVLSSTYSPMNPLHAFHKQAAEFAEEFENTPIDKVKEIFAKRGVEVNEYTAKAKYNELRADVLGRKAMGSLAVTGAVALVMNDRIRGNGLYDRQKQALRRDMNWKPRTIDIPGVGWVSYDNLGPMSNWLALTVDVFDNFDTLAPNDMMTQAQKMGFILGASITKKSHVAGLEGLFDVLSMNGGALSKWASSFLTAATIPGSSQLAEISRLMDPNLKQVDQELTQMIQNRLPLVKKGLPDVHDYVDGGKVGVPDNIMARIWNTYAPWKVNGKISPEKQFLIDIEYDGRPNLRTNGKGTKLTPEQISSITDIMGRDGLFKAGIQRVMSMQAAKAFRKDYKRAIDKGMEPDLDTYGGIHAMLDKELKYARDAAVAASPHVTEIRRKQMVRDTVDQYLKRGDQDAAERFLDYMEQNFSR